MGDSQYALQLANVFSSLKSRFTPQRRFHGQSDDEPGDG
jgi:hypothetical protein